MKPITNMMLQEKAEGRLEHHSGCGSHMGLLRSVRPVVLHRTLTVGGGRVHRGFGRSNGGYV